MFETYLRWKIAKFDACRIQRMKMRKREREGARERGARITFCRKCSIPNLTNLKFGICTSKIPHKNKFKTKHSLCFVPHCAIQIHTHRKMRYVSIACAQKYTPSAYNMLRERSEKKRKRKNSKHTSLRVFSLSVYIWYARNDISRKQNGFGMNVWGVLWPRMCSWWHISGVVNWVVVLFAHAQQYRR